MNSAHAKQLLWTCILFVTLVAPGKIAFAADQNSTPDRPTVVHSSPLEVVSPYFAKQSLTLSNGLTLEKIIINGPPTPPMPEQHRAVDIPLNRMNSATSHVISDIPAFTWCFGCAATSAAMIAGYFDRHGYPNIYTGPTNNGVMPLNNDTYWSTYTDSNGDVGNRCPLSATQKGLDGRVTRGHVDDYWKYYGNTGPDPFVDHGWAEHTLGDCTADFMGTNQASSPMENSDGSTKFWISPDGSKTTTDILYSWGPDCYNASGLYGIKEFYESRGYTVTEAFNQNIYGYNGYTQGFTFKDYMNVIDSNTPILIQVEGHTMVGVGYDNSSGQIVYLHDTWDHSSHTMTWGGSYQGMQHLGVSVVKLAPSNGGSAVYPSAINILLN